MTVRFRPYADGDLDQVLALCIQEEWPQPPLLPHQTNPLAPPKA